jgi:hypothetical protein
VDTTLVGLAGAVIGGVMALPGDPVRRRAEVARLVEDPHRDPPPVAIKRSPGAAAACSFDVASPCVKPTVTSFQETTVADLFSGRAHHCERGLCAGRGYFRS